MLTDQELEERLTWERCAPNAYQGIDEAVVSMILEIKERRAKEGVAAVTPSEKLLSDIEYDYQQLKGWLAHVVDHPKSLIHRILCVPEVQSLIRDFMGVPILLPHERLNGIPK